MVIRIANSTEYNNNKLVDGTKAKGTTLTGTDTGLDKVNITSTAVNGTYTISSTTAGKLKLTGDSAAGGVSQEIDVTADDAQEVHFDQLGITLKLDDDFEAADGDNSNASSLNNGTIAITSDSTDITLQIGADNTTQDQLAFNLGSMTDEGLGISLSKLDGNTGADAQSAIDQLDAAIAKVSDERSNVGALQNRLEFTSSNLMNSIQNNAASMSTIRDADFAAEAADLAKNRILVQSGTSMLAQANSLSQNVLALIR